MHTDISKYKNNILDIEDRPLFHEAVVSAKAGALRAAYVMIWLSCAESLKRRFREARNYDHNAGKIVGQVNQREEEHKSVDKFLLDKALGYGFISDSDHALLSHIYEMRSIYAHPYEKEPSQEQVIHAAASVVDLVLSHPVKLRHGFVNRLLNDMLQDSSYLDDQYSAVADYVKKILPRIDESVYEWTLEKYWKELEENWDDPSMRIFLRRGRMFSRAMLRETGVNLFTEEKWHSLVQKFPKTLMIVCSIRRIFNKIGDFAQDSLVGAIIEESEIRSSALTRLEYLDGKNALSKRQKERFHKRITQLTPRELRSSNLSTKICYEKLVSAMKSHTWPTQNPAINLFTANGPKQAAELDHTQQETIGRNILQASEGKSRSGITFLRTLVESSEDWPIGILQGIVLESFINEDDKIRAKIKHIHIVVSALDELDNTPREELISEIAESLMEGTPGYGTSRQDFNPVFDMLGAYTWAEPILNALNAQLPYEPYE